MGQLISYQPYITNRGRRLVADRRIKVATHAPELPQILLLAPRQPEEPRSHWPIK